MVHCPLYSPTAMFFAFGLLWEHRIGAGRTCSLSLFVEVLHVCLRCCGASPLPQEEGCPYVWVTACACPVFAVVPMCQ